MTPDSPTTSDESIVERVTNGRVEEYEMLMQRYEAKLLRYVRYLIHDESAAYDVVQETFIKAYRNLQGFNSAYKFSSWIYRIAHNESMNFLKKHPYTVDSDTDYDPELSYDTKLEESIDAEILKDHVHECVARLEPKYRDVIQLAYFEHMKYREISDVLHIPQPTVGVRLSRAKDALKKICKHKGVSR